MEYYDISIIIPVYNAEAYLRKCIHSLLLQNTELTYCIILINDGSIDTSLEICRTYSEKHKNIYVYAKDNGGTSTAKNLGIDKANSKYIMFVDSDDYVDENYISSLFTNGCDYDFYVSGYSIIYEKNNLRIDNLPNLTNSKKGNLPDLLSALKSEGVLNVDVGKIYLLEILNNYNIRFKCDMTTGEDLVFNCEYIERITSFYVIDSSHYYYIRRDVESLVNSYKKGLSEMISKCLNAVIKLYDGNVNEENKKYLSNIYFDYSSTEMINLFRKECTLSKSEKIQMIKNILHDDNLQLFTQSSNRNDNLSKIFRWCFLSKNAKLTFYILSVLFFIRYKLSYVYYWIRKKMIINKGR